MANEGAMSNTVTTRIQPNNRTYEAKISLIRRHSVPQKLAATYKSFKVYYKSFKSSALRNMPETSLTRHKHGSKLLCFFQILNKLF